MTKVFNRTPFVSIAETLFTAMFSKENIRKNAKKKRTNVDQTFVIERKP